MAITPVPTIDPALPIPPNLADEEAVFDAKAYAWSEALPGFGSDVKAIGDATYANAQWAQTKALEAAEQVPLAAAQVDLAADQVDLAADQVDLAAAQVALAAAQVSIAAGHASNAGDSASAAADSASAAADSAVNALASEVAASKLNLGDFSSPPTTDNQGQPLRINANYYDTTLGRIRSWSGSAWADGISAVAGVSSVNGQTGDIVLPPGIINIAYDDRAQLRGNSTGTHALVEGLGLFQYVSGSDDPDDDESCFATATGRWLLQAAHWDLVDAWQLPEVEERDAYDEDEPLRFAASFAAKVITGSATCAITSVTNVSSASFTGTVAGAALGDRVIATPPAQLGATAAETGCLSYHAFVSAPDTITIVLTNASAAAATTNAAVQTAWPITVIKS